MAVSNTIGDKTEKRISRSVPEARETCYSEPSLMRPLNKEISLETFLLVWLDPHVNANTENQKTQRRLQKILTRLVTFDNIESCEQWVKINGNNEKIILIVSGAYGKQIVPKIHYLPSIISIHVYCLDINLNKTWASNYPKIRSVVSRTKDLLTQISINQNNLESIEDSNALQIHSLDIELASYISYFLLLEILLSPQYLSWTNTFDRFIQLLREYNSNEEHGSNFISEFEQTYKAEQAVSWLLRDTPLVRYINKTLREQDIDMLFTLRFFLVDIHNQLTEHQADSVNAFRIQSMMKQQMENLSTNPGQFLVVNGFLFASKSMPVLNSKTENNDQFEIVLMKIKAKYRSGVASFVFLDELNGNLKKQTDHEILFMCGSLFQVGSLVCENSIWTLELTLLSDHDVPSLISIKHQLRKTHNLCIIGDILYRCGKPNNAKIYYQRLLSELPEKHALMPRIRNQVSGMPEAKSSK